MWKLILADTFHLNTTSYQTSLTTICMSLYINSLLQMRDTRYGLIIFLWIAFLIISQLISPIRITKGFYLCPLTENDRKSYLKISFLVRYICHELVFAIALILVRLLKNYDYRILLIFYINISFVFLVTLLLTGFYNPETVKRQYFIMKKIPAPTNKQQNTEKKQRSTNGTYLLIIILIASSFGIFIPVYKDLYDTRWLFYYIPAYILCFICLLFYFLKHFDTFITVNANYEVYSFTLKKKAGVH